MTSQRHRKHAKLALQKPRVYRERIVEDSDYRWWRYQDEEPASGFIDTSYVEQYQPYWVPRATPVHQPARTKLSATQLRKRLYQARGGRGLGALVRQVIQAQSTVTLVSGNPSAPLKQALTQLVGKRVTHKVLRGVREPFIMLDEFWLHSSPGLGEALSNMMRSHRKVNTQGLIVTQELAQLT